MTETRLVYRGRNVIGGLCKNRHLLTEENTKITTRKGRSDSLRCLECVRTVNSEVRRPANVPGELCSKGIHMLVGDNLVYRVHRKGMQPVPTCLECDRKTRGYFSKPVKPKSDNPREIARRKRRADEKGRTSDNLAKARRRWYLRLGTIIADEDSGENVAKADQDKPSSPWVLLRPKPVAREAWASFQEALSASDETGKRLYKPNCEDNPAEWTDYADQGEEPRPGQQPFPSRIQAEALCEGCPLLALCAEYARLDQPTTGVWGPGVRYVHDDKDKTGYRGRIVY